jgi:HlyD family secretion protein
MWNKISKKTLFIVIISAVILGIIYLVQKGDSNGNAMEYEYEPVSMGDVSKSISASGRLDLFRSETVLSRINGVMSQLFADFNQNVRMGDLLGHIDSEEADGKFADVKETFRRASLELESVKDFYESKKTLFEEQLVSQKEVDEARRNYEKAQTVFNQTKLIYDNASAAVNAKNVYAPMSGMILQCDVTLRQPITVGKMLFVIAPDMRKMKLIINIDESDIGYVKAGLPVDFSVSAYPDKVFSGTIMQVRMNPVLVVVGPNNRITTYESLVECDNSKLFLRPGMTVAALVNIARKSDVKRVPNAAFMISPVAVESVMGKKYVWKKERLTMKSLPMRRIEVKTGIIGDDFTEVISDELKVGDEILIGMHKKFDMKGIPDGK